MTIILRSRQYTMVNRSLKALEIYGNTLSIAPTGAGKTIMMASILGQSIKDTQRGLVLQHRHELLEQNQNKFVLMNPSVTTSLFRAQEKNTQGQVIFGMAQTLGKERNLALMPKIEVLAIDEAHHSMASSYLKIIDALKAKNPDLKILGLTATPSRGDRQKLLSVFNNVADQIYLSELIISGHLVAPKTFDIDLGYNTELMDLFQGMESNNLESEALMAKACVIMNTDVYCEEVVRNWQERALNRPTVIFCTTIHHAQHIQEVFQSHGIKAAHVNGKMTPFEREANLKLFTDGIASVITNVAVLTEGWDYPPTSCIMICRPCSFKSTYIQMVGRGLRTSGDKDHCVVLDFGLSSSLHGSLEQIIHEENEQTKKEYHEPQKTCPKCEGFIPVHSQTCPLCGYDLQNAKDLSKIAGLENPLTLKEIDALEQSPYRWEEIAVDMNLSVGCKSFLALRKNPGGTYSIFGGENYSPKAKHLHKGTKQNCLYHGEAYINERETSYNKPCKGTPWHSLAPTDKQLGYLHGVTVKDRYHASVLLTLKFNKEAITPLLTSKEASQSPAC